MNPAPVTDQKPCLLFVDDDQRVLDGLSASLRRMRHQWNMEFVCGGAAAIERLGAGRVHGVVTDMRMPGMDGEAVLHAARAHCPEAVRVVLSGQTERSIVCRVAAVAHLFLSKPSSAEEVRTCLQQQMDFTRPLTQRERELLCGIGHVRASPRALAHLRDLSNKSSPDLAELVACIESDPALVAMMLHAASAGFFGVRRPATSIRAAVALVGTEASLAILSTLEERTHDRYAARTIQHACTTGELLARMLGRDDARAWGRLHALGKLILLDHFGQGYGELLERSESDADFSLHEFELARYGARHEMLGAKLVGLWGMPVPWVEAIGNYAAPADAARAGELAVALHVASALARGGTEFAEPVLNQHVVENMPRWTAWARELQTQALPL